MAHSGPLLNSPKLVNLNDVTVSAANADQTIGANLFSRFYVSDRILGCVRAAIPQPTEWQHFGNQVNAAFIFARTQFVSVQGCTALTRFVQKKFCPFSTPKTTISLAVQIAVKAHCCCILWTEKRFVIRADEKLIALVQFEAAIWTRSRGRDMRKNLLVDFSLKNQGLSPIGSGAASVTILASNHEPQNLTARMLGAKFCQAFGRTIPRCT